MEFECQSPFKQANGIPLQEVKKLVCKNPSKKGLDFDYMMSLVQVPL